MKKQASTLLPALLDLLRQYLALDMAVYAGHATLLLLTASLPLLMWVLVIINMLQKALVNSYFSRFCAGGVLVAVPISILFVIMQKFYVEGITSGAAKG